MLKEERVTNIVTEFLATVVAMETLAKNNLQEGRIITNSKYLVDCVSKYIPKERKPFGGILNVNQWRTRNYYNIWTSYTYN